VRIVATAQRMPLGAQSQTLELDSNMPKVTYITASGGEMVVDGKVGESLMQIAVDNAVPGVLGDCGGCCSCATCHAYVDPQSFAKLAPASEDENMMLEGGPDLRPTSRLTCQIRMSPELDGIVLSLPGE
jgi:2Fe-2S ferredoxin